MHLAVEQILTQIVGFLIMLWVLKKIFWHPILNVMQERQRTIAAEFDFIRKEKEDVKKLAEDYQRKIKDIEAEMKSKIQEGVEKGERLAREIEQDTRKKATDILNKAQQEVKKEMAEAKTQLKSEIVNISIAAAQKLIQETLTKEKHQKLIEDAIEKIELK